MQFIRPLSLGNCALQGDMPDSLYRPPAGDEVDVGAFVDATLLRNVFSDNDACFLKSIQGRHPVPPLKGYYCAGSRYLEGMRDFLARDGGGKILRISLSSHADDCNL